MNETQNALDKHLARLSEYGLARYAEAAWPFMRHAIRLLPQTDAAAVGGSKIGGLPDLPPEMPWPQYQGRPMSLIAQIDLAAAQPFDADRLLPSNGMLYLFYELEAQEWGYDPAHAGGFQLLYFAGDKQTLQRRPAPAGLQPDALLAESALEFATEAELPAPDNHLLAACPLNDDEYEAWWDYEADLELPPSHKLLGHSEPIQGPMELQCQLVSHGLYCGDASGYQDPRRAELEAGAADWRLLMQIDSDEQMMWGDCGRLYVWIRQQDLAAQHFERAWLILQCS